MCVIVCNFVSYFVCVILCIFVFLCDILLPSGVINDDDKRIGLDSNVIVVDSTKVRNSDILLHNVGSWAAA